MRVIAVYQLKGGVGKTATAVNLSALLARRGSPTLLWDLDPQGAATFYFRIAPKVDGGRKVFHDADRLSGSIRASDFPDLDLVPADFSYRKLDRRLETDDALIEALEPLADEYDTVVLDCPPSAGALAENVFRVADALIVPTIPTPLSLRTLAQLMSHLKSRSGRRPRVLPFFSMVDRRKSLHNRVIEWAAEEKLGFLDAAIPYSAEVERMGVRRGPIFMWAPRCPAAIAFGALFDEVAAALDDESALPSPLFKKRARKLLERAGRDANTRVTSESSPTQTPPPLMPSSQEIEFKFLVEDATAFERLSADVPGVPYKEPILQVNHFFDAADERLRENGIALRLRQEGAAPRSRWIVTAKGPKKGVDPLVAARPEEEIVVDENYAKMVLAGEASPLVRIRSEIADSPLLDKLDAILDGHKLVHTGSFENERARLGPVAIEAGGRNHALLYELDTTRFPGSRIDHEIEVEVRATEDADALREHLLSQLKRLDIAWQPAESKAKRFRKALENGHA